MRHPPEDEDDRKEWEQMRGEPWMREALALNPDYCSWGPYEDYMGGTGSGWDGRVIAATWAECGFKKPDDLNEVVNFYFYAQRDSKNCETCDGSGYNPATKQIADDFYSHSSATGHGWSEDPLTDDEVQALKNNRRWPLGPFGHDAINRFILIETRAKRLGAWGHCSKCDGHGFIYTEERARLGLVLWVIHPRKGASRGVDVKSVRRDDLPDIARYLKEAADRNAARFAKVAALSPEARR